MVKFVGCLRRKPGMTEADLHQRKNIHGPLVKNAPEFFRYGRQYVQGRALKAPAPGFPSPLAPLFAGVAEPWFDSSADIGKAFSKPRYREIIRPDELRSLDLPTCNLVSVEEVLRPE